MQFINKSCINLGLDTVSQYIKLTGKNEFVYYWGTQVAKLQYLVMNVINEVYNVTLLSL